MSKMSLVKKFLDVELDFSDKYEIGDDQTLIADSAEIASQIKKSLTTNANSPVSNLNITIRGDKVLIREEYVSKASKLLDKLSTDTSNESVTPKKYTEVVIRLTGDISKSFPEWLSEVGKSAATGHSFDIVADGTGDNPIKTGIDGDGADSLKVISVKEINS